MTRIDFYFNAPDKLETAVKLVRKAYTKRNRLTIYSRDAQQLDAVDRMLWTSPPTGFVPHCRAGHKLAAQTPILLATDAAIDPSLKQHHEVLLNLDPDLPAAFSRYERVLEIVSRDDQADRQQARSRLKFYRDRGYEIGTIDLDTLRDKAAT